MYRSISTRIGLAVFACLSVLFTATSIAQGYPNRAVRMVVGFPPGGFTDILARQVAERLTPVMGQTVVVDNRSGAAGVIGADVVAKAKPDGYTVLMGHNNSNAVAPSLYSKLPYDARKDFAPVALMAWSATVLVVHPAVPARSVKEFIEVARKTQGKLLVASSGVGSTQHLALERFKLAIGVGLTHVPYKGSGPAVIDLIGGQVDANFDGLGVVLPYVKAGKLRALGVGLLQRARQLPDVPTIDEQGVKGFESGSWFGVFMPAGTPRDIIERWASALQALLASSDFTDRIATLGGQPVKSNSPAEFAAFVERDIERWAKIIALANVKVE